MKQWEYDAEFSDWVWITATLDDVPEIVKMAQDHFQLEVDGIFKQDPTYYNYNLTRAVVDQNYSRASQLLFVCREKHTEKLLAYSWVGRGSRMPYAHEEMAEAKIAHLDLELSPRKRLMLLSQMLKFWENWAKACDIPVLVSSSIRAEQDGFMKLHERAGFKVRGSIAYKRLTGETK